MAVLLEQAISTMSGLAVSGRAKSVWEARVELDRRRPDLVLLDEVLPGESSLDLLQELNLAAIPVILMTSMEMPSVNLPAGALGRLIKPGWKSFEADQTRLERQILELFGKLKRS